MPPPYYDPCNPHYHHHHHHHRRGIEIDVYPGWQRPYYPQAAPRTEVVVVTPAATYVPPQGQYYNNGGYNNGAYYNNGCNYNNPPYRRW